MIKSRLALALFCLFGLCAANAASAADAKVFRIGDVNAEGHVIVKTAQFFADKVKELSGGAMQVDVYPSGQLGDDYRSYELLKMGALDFYRGNAGSMADLGDLLLNATALPYMYRDREHYWQVAKAPVGQKILDDIQAKGTGIVGIVFFDEGMRNFFTTKTPVRKLADMEGLKIRVHNSDIMMSTIEALKANPTPIDYNELYSALQTGVVDGAENPPSSYLSNLFYEPAPYYVLDGHTYAPSVLIASERVWNGLTDAERAIFLQAAAEAQTFNRAAIEEADESAYAALREKGVEITELSDKADWIKAMDPIYERFGASYLDVIKEIQGVQ